MVSEFVSLNFCSLRGTSLMQIRGRFGDGVGALVVVDDFGVFLYRGSKR